MFLPLGFLLATSAGVISHNLVFVRGEYHMHAPMLLLLSLIFTLCLFLLFLFRDSNYHVMQNAMVTFSVISTYSISLLLSITIYRTRFHRLRNFPGPFGAKVTKLWHVWKTRDSKNYKLMEELHQKYGDFVRTGQFESQSYQ